jgi:hypothetical protein
MKNLYGSVLYRDSGKSEISVKLWRIEDGYSMKSIRKKKSDGSDTAEHGILIFVRNTFPDAAGAEIRYNECAVVWRAGIILISDLPFEIHSQVKRGCESSLSLLSERSDRVIHYSS